MQQYWKWIWHKIGGVNKLVPNLDSKRKYVLHYRLKKYSDFNTDRRKNAANSFEKDFFKLMNNSTFGKTMESLRKGINVILVNNAKNYKKCISEPCFV